MRVLKLFSVAVACFLLMYLGFKFFEQVSNGTKYATYATGEMAALTYFDNPKSVITFPIQLENGQEYIVSPKGGKVRLLNLWASWCGPCLVEMPSLDRLQGILGSDKFEVLAINEDVQGIPKAREFMDKLELKHLTLYADPTMIGTFSIAENKLPTSLVIDKNGYVIAKYTGSREWDSDEAIELLQYLIDEE